MSKSASSFAPGATATPQDLDKVFNTYNTAVGKAIKDLQSLNPTGETAKFNADLIKLMQDLQKQLPALRNSKSADAMEKWGQDFQDRPSKLGDQYKSTTDKLSQCS
jgi:hypothetical protein